MAEYNYWCDPHAAKVVYEAFAGLPQLKGKRIHMVGLDVTRKIVLTPSLLWYMQSINPSMGSRIAAITRFYMDFHWKQEGIIGCVINDPLAVAYFIDRRLCSGLSCYTTIETEGICMGQSVSDTMDFWKKPHNSFILTQTDAFGFIKFFLQRVIHAQESQMESVLPQIMAPDPACDFQERGGFL